MPGLAPFAQAELRHRFGKQVAFLAAQSQTAEALIFRFTGSLRHLLKLRRIQAIYLSRRFAIPRPKALLGHQYFQQLLRDIETVLRLHPPSTFRTFRLSAAGDTSRIFTRLKTEISSHTGLSPEAEEADLVLRIRPVKEPIKIKTNSSNQGWEVLIRLSPRPLATRPWRVRDFPGALNASIAAAMIDLLQPKPRDRFFNFMCGSGTLLIERQQVGQAKTLWGCDIDHSALTASQANLTAAAKLTATHLRPNLLRADLRQTPFPAHSFDALCADLPWGQLVGSHTHNMTLYPQVLNEVTRLAMPKARLVLLTHEIKLMDQVYAQVKADWQLKENIKLGQGGLHPRLYLLQRRKSR